MPWRPPLLRDHGNDMLSRNKKLASIVTPLFSCHALILSAFDTLVCRHFIIDASVSTHSWFQLFHRWWIDSSCLSSLSTQYPYTGNNISETDNSPTSPHYLQLKYHHDIGYLKKILFLFKARTIRRWNWFPWSADKVGWYQFTKKGELLLNLTQYRFQVPS